MARGVEADRIIQEIGKANNRVVTYRALASAGIGGNLITLRVARAHGHSGEARQRVPGRRRRDRALAQHGAHAQLPAPITRYRDCER